MSRTNTPASIWEKIDQSGGPDSCWEWRGCSQRGGYGIFSFSGKQYLAHRWVAEQSGMSIIGRVVRHGCDNRKCCNPAHLATGTLADNIRDRVERGRSARGEAHGRRRLSDAEVLEIRRRYAMGGVSQYALAPEYGVSRSTIADVVSRKNWRHLPPVPPVSQRAL